MGCAIPGALRAEIIQRCQSGQSPAEVSRALNLGYAGVAKLWRRYRREGESALHLGYERCGRRPVYDGVVQAAVDRYVLTNPALGAPYIRSKLLAEGVLGAVPHERTIQRWWRAAGRQKPRGRRPHVQRTYTQQVHDTWQVDGKEQVSLASGQQVCYLSCADEATGSFLQGHVFPLHQSDALRQR